MKRLVGLVVLLAACGDNKSSGNPVDARPDSAHSDAPIDTPDIDAPDVDAPPSGSEQIAAVRAAADGPVDLTVQNVTVTYLKPQIGSTTNDPSGFTVQAAQNGPAIMVAVDPMGIAVNPTLAVGDVISFKVTEKATVGGQPRATMITDVTRSAQGTDVTPLVQDVSAATDLVANIDSYDSELITVTATIAGNFAPSGSMWERAPITTAGVTTADPNYQLRVPATLRNLFDLVDTCAVTVSKTPVGRFNAQAQLTAIITSDISVTSCPAPTVGMAAAPSATTVVVNFTRNIDATSVMTNGSQFTIDNGLTVSDATVSGRTVTLTTSAQVPGTTYTVTVANTVEDTVGAGIGTPASTTFLGFTPVVAATHLVINEVDYDQTATDANSFIEIYNPTNAAIPLANYAVVYVNGGSTGGPTGTVYPMVSSRVMLSAAGTEIPAGGYLVIRNSTVTVPNGTLTIDQTGDFLQNGADGIALIDTNMNALVDAIHYASAANGAGAGISMATIMGFAATVSLVEGMMFTTADTQTGSIGRFPNGADTDNAALNWSLLAAPTPGAANAL